MMKFPKEDFTLGIYSNKSEKAPLQTDILALVREKGTLGLEEVESLHSPEDGNKHMKRLFQSFDEKLIMQYLKQHKQSCPPFRIVLISENSKLIFQSEEKFALGKYERNLHINHRNAEAMATLKQLQSLTAEITGDTLGSQQLAALEQLSEKFSNHYEIRIAVSNVFLQNISRDINALNLWDDIHSILHGGKIPQEWPCRDESYVELELTSLSSSLFYSIAFDTRNVLSVRNKNVRREWFVSEQIANSRSFDKPVFQSDDERSLKNGKEVVPDRMKSRLAECTHPFAKEILALKTACEVANSILIN